MITDDGSPTLIDHASGDSMHSGCGALAETEHVYLSNSGVAAALEQHRPQAVLEIGLGTGLALLATAQLAERLKTPVLYLAIETKPLPSQVIEQLQFDRLGIASHLINDLCSLLNKLQPHTTSGQIGSQCEATLCIEDAEHWQPSNPGSFDAIFFDPFSPATSPLLWTVAVFERMHRSLRSGGKLVSYCVNRRVRDELAVAGFEVDRVPGPPGGKREVLIATKQ